MESESNVYLRDAAAGWSRSPGGSGTVSCWWRWCEEESIFITCVWQISCHVELPENSSYFLIWCFLESATANRVAILNTANSSHSKNIFFVCSSFYLPRMMHMYDLELISFIWKIQGDLIRKMPREDLSSFYQPPCVYIGKISLK